MGDWPLVREVGKRADSSSVVGEGESTNPMPGVRGVLGAMGGRVAGSVLRRQERAKTPVRRMIVPRPI